jgi:hypothetical protein
VGPNVVIGDFLRNNPQFLVKGSLEGLKNVLNEGATYFAVNHLTLILVFTKKQKIMSCFILITFYSFC